MGHFANVVDLGGVGVAISTDGVGTKTVVADLLGRYDTVGYDCVAVNVNDVIAVGAEPNAFVDYVAVQRADDAMMDQIGAGLYEGAAAANVSVVGGEAAQLPELLLSHEGGNGFDLAGTCIGTVEPGGAITGSRVEPGQAVIGLRSSGIHCNGLTLARKAFGITLEQPRESKLMTLMAHADALGCTLGDELLRRSRIYVDDVIGMLNAGLDVRGLAHISGDGLLNLPRLEASVGYMIDSLPEPHPIFHLIQERGQCPRKRRCTRSSTWVSASASCCPSRTWTPRLTSHTATARTHTASATQCRTRTGRSRCPDSGSGAGAAQDSSGAADFIDAFLCLR